MMKLSYWIVVTTASLLLSGCYIETDVKLDVSDNLYLSKILISIDQGPEIIEASTRHALNILGIRDSFDIKKWNPSDFTMEDYLLLKPTKRLPIQKSNRMGDNIRITSTGNQKKLEWVIEQRVQAFADKLSRGDPEQLNKVFLVIRISFPGSVDMANTSDSEGNVYTWRITNAQMAKPFKIQAIYSSK